MAETQTWLQTRLLGKIWVWGLEGHKWLAGLWLGNLWVILGFFPGSGPKFLKTV